MDTHCVNVCGFACAQNMAMNTAIKVQSLQPGRSGWALVIHGGASFLPTGGFSEEKQAGWHAGLRQALAAGSTILDSGGSALDAVEAAVIALEDNPAFNAGYGSVLTRERSHELDASIMDGRQRNSGAVVCVSHVRNPIRAARLVMEKSPHIMFTGSAADKFAVDCGLEPVANNYFTTEMREKMLQRALSAPAGGGEKLGTVGAVALDLSGNLAAATSTGGTNGKAPGRVGDSPIIGAGTYADSNVCAVSATGHGEHFIRIGVARMIAARIELAGQSAEAAARETLQDVAAIGGAGGVIVVSHSGEITLAFNTSAMFRGFAAPGGISETAVFDNGE